MKILSPQRLGPSELASMFEVPLIDYGREGDAVLIASGAGIMMATMDQVPRIRWCVDADCMRALPWRVEWFMTALDRNSNVSLLAVAGWFSLDTPEHLRRGLQSIERMRVETYSGNLGVFDGESASFAEFVGRFSSNSRG
jgi:hypothetical protein